MLEYKKDLAVLETNLSSVSTKRSPFHLLSSIFSKKKSSSLDNEDHNKDFRSTAHLYQSLCSQNSTPEGTSRRTNPDLETLHLSRQDNPYLKSLECFSEETILACADLNSLAEKALLQSEWHLGSEDVDIHQHLVRSPPPQFPQNITHFIYSQANSPKKQSNQSNNERVEESPEKRKKPLNPVHPKKETGVLDPGIRAVLEYQKSQLIAGHSPSPARWTSLPGLASSEERRTALAPIRTLSDSVCHDKHRKVGTNH